MLDEWSKIAEQVMLAAVENKVRVIAVTSPAGGAGVTTVARGLANAFADSGRRTLLIDLSAAAAYAAKTVPWSPDEPLRLDGLGSRNESLTVMSAAPPAASRGLFNNTDLLETAFRHDLSGYSNIVLDLPALRGDAPDSVNPVAVARAADAVFIVAPTGLTSRTEMADAMQRLRQVGAPIAGIIMNDRHCNSLGVEIARTVRAHLGRYLPWLAERIARYALSSAYLTRNFRITG